MFVETEERKHGEITEAPAKVLKLSDLVRKFGYTDGVKADKCVLACAYRGATGGELSSDCWGSSHGDGTPSQPRKFIRHAAATFGISYEMADETETRCMQGIPPNKIADWLESKGY